MGIITKPFSPRRKFPRQIDRGRGIERRNGPGKQGTRNNKKQKTN